MSTSTYPVTKDTFVNPNGSDNTVTVSHSAQHTLINDAVGEIQDYLGENEDGQTGPLQGGLFMGKPGEAGKSIYSKELPDGTLPQGTAGGVVVKKYHATASEQKQITVGPGTTGQVLTSNGASADPSFQSITSGELYLPAASAILPASNFPQLTKNTSGNLAWLLGFDDTTDESCQWNFTNNSGTDLSSTAVTAYIYYVNTATTGTVTWDVDLVRLADNDLISSVATIESETVTDTVSGTADDVNICSVTFSGYLANNEMGILKLTRDVSEDSHVGDIKLLHVSIPL